MFKLRERRHGKNQDVKMDFFMYKIVIKKKSFSDLLTLLLYLGIYAKGYIAFIIPLECMLLRLLVTFHLVSRILVQFLGFSFSKWLYFSSHSVSLESIHIWTMGSLEGLHLCHKFLPHGSCPGAGLKV